ncbi:MAG: DUF3187 family protein [Gammaproteobacteria bacterium]|nr:DUF3187 family protein [Gammaproteobacteria bacterium]
MSIKSPVRLIATRAFLCLLVFLIPAKAAFSATPLQTHDLNPLTVVYGLPLVSPARLPETRLSLSLNVSNTINVEDKANESLYIDGETSELNLIYLFAVNEKTTLRLRLPFISHGAGSLDSFIDDFHGVFGFPEGSRPSVDNNQFLFLYQQNNIDLIRIDEANDGIGDIAIDAGYQLYAKSDIAASLWSSLKLPTGDENLLTGSGKTDVAIWYAAENNFTPNWSRYYNIGLLLPGNSDILPDQQKQEVYFGTAGIEWRTTNIVTLNIQFDFHTAFYQSDTKFLGDSIQISSGGHIKLTSNSRIEIVVIEDIQVGASPDVTFQLGFSLLL